LSFGPTLSLIQGAGLFSGNLAPSQVTASSGTNVFGPTNGSTSIQGIVRIEFDSPINSIGAYFFDVEADFALTGFSTVLGAAPDVTFSAFQGQSSQTFLGLVSSTPLTGVDIHFATGPSIDGTVIDDLRFGASSVPEPSSLFVLIGAAGMLAVGRRRSI